MGKEEGKYKIFQIFYNEVSKKKIDPSFTPYDNSKGDAKWFEYGVFRDNYLNGEFKKNEYTGFLSWKFQQKTGITGYEFLEFIRKNPGYDVYFINPFQLYTNRFKNVWDSGEYSHPGLKEIVNSIFQKIGYKIDLDKIVNSHEDSLYCNYWVGNLRFWNLFMEFCEPIFTYIESSGDSFIEERILREADAVIDATFIPFIMERMFSTLLFLHKGKIKSIPYTYKSLRKYPFCIYPFYKNLEKLKILELQGKDVQASREQMLLHIDSYTKIMQDADSRGFINGIISRILFVIRVILKRS